MKMKDFKSATKKQKLILLGVAASLGIIILGVGLGVGLSGTSGTFEELKDDKTPNTTIPVKETNYTFTEREDEEGKKEVIVRFKEKTTLEQIKSEVEDLKTDLKDKTIGELRLPFAIKTEFETTADGKTTIDVKKIKDKLGVDVDANKVGFIFYPSDDKEETKTYKDKNIVEVVLSPEVTNVIREKFKNNRIKEVNWDELVNLEIISQDAFGINNLEGDLDLSKLVNLKVIVGYAFQQNKLNGTLTLPPNIVEIGTYAFSSFPEDRVKGKGINKISGTLKLPRSLKNIKSSAFEGLSISELDWSDAESLEVIESSAFAGNKLSSLKFSKTSLPSLHTIRSNAFENNSGELLEGIVELPINLLTIFFKAIKVKSGTTIYISPKATDIKDTSFEGDVTILKYPEITKDTDHWQVITETNPIDTTKEIKTLRVKKDTTLEQFKTIKTELTNESVDISTMNEIHIPYSLRKQKSVDKLAEELGLPINYDNNKIGFIFNKEDYDADSAVSDVEATNYQNKNIVEVNLDSSITTIPKNAFSNNKIKEVNFEELVNLETLGNRAFNNNSLEKDLDLSKLTKLKIIGLATFANNSLTGRIILPPNIEEIKSYAFNFQDRHFEHIRDNKLIGELKFPSSLKKIGNFAFAYNNLTKIDWSEAEKLENILGAAFTQNKISGLDFDNFPPNLSFIGDFAFDKTVDKSIKSNITLSPKLLYIGTKAFEVADNITITISPNATDITVNSFIGTGIKVVKGTGDGNTPDPNTGGETTNPDPNTGGGTTTTPTTPTNIESYYNVVEETDSTDSTKQIKTLRIEKETKTLNDLTNISNDLKTKGIDITSFNKLLLPYHFKSTHTEEQIKNELKVQYIIEGNVNYIFNKTDYTATGNYQGSKIAELNLPESVIALKQLQFDFNAIEKVNWSELVNLKSIGVQAFGRNKLTGDLDLSVLTALTSIKDSAFTSNKLNGTLTLPPNIQTIGKQVFNSLGDRSNKIKGTLKLPKSLISIGKQAFVSNNIEKLDWSEAENLKTIGERAFSNNKLKTLNFNADVLPKIETIESLAFADNPGKNDKHEMFTENFTLPPSLKTIGGSAITIKDGITISISTSATGIKTSSFVGDPRFTRQSQA